jgi:hypothetical protein
MSGNKCGINQSGVAVGATVLEVWVAAQFVIVID